MQGADVGHTRVDVEVGVFAVQQLMDHKPSVLFQHHVGHGRVIADVGKEYLAASVDGGGGDFISPVDTAQGFSGEQHLVYLVGKVLDGGAEFIAFVLGFHV